MKRLKYSTIESEVEEFEVSWRKRKFIVKFSENGVDDRLIRFNGDDSLGWRSIEIIPSKGGADHLLLNFISVYLGEDVFPVRAIAERERPELRGKILFNSLDFQNFLNKAEIFVDLTRNDKWREECVQTSFGYFCGALEMGLEFSPATPGIFAVCTEVIANAWNFSSIHHKKFRAKDGPEDMFRTIQEKEERELMLADVALIYSLRNKAGSHFSLHIERDRNQLIDELRQWLVRRGCSKEFAEISFTAERLPMQLQSSGAGLYKTALTVARFGFFILIDAAAQFYVATRDLRA